MANRYDQGDLVRVTGTWTDPLNAGVPIDPTAVNLSVKSPNGTITTYVYGVDSEVVKDSAGVYHMDIDLNKRGRWYYLWWSTGVGQAAEQGKIIANEVIRI